MSKSLAVTVSVVFLLLGCSHENSTLPQLTGLRHPSNYRSGSSPASTTSHFSILYTFKDGADGAAPNGGLVRDTSGRLYGTTVTGGGSAYTGVVFDVDQKGNENVLHTFNGFDGQTPEAGVVRDAAGNIYGTTLNGGSSDNGVVFKVDTGGNETVLHSFGGSDGLNPQSSLVRDAAGNLYGTTQIGGSFGDGVVFKVDASGNETVLHSFDGTDGNYPVAGVIRDSAGNLYGTTIFGGNSGCNMGCGVVFELHPNGTETLLHSFAGMDGQWPEAGLVQDSAGNLYGTTFNGGASSCFDGCGVVFKLDQRGKESIVHRFYRCVTCASSIRDGINPVGSLVRDANGNLYGTTLSGGGDSSVCSSTGCGIVFEINSGGTESVLHSFNGTDGSAPVGALVRDSAGNIFGATAAGGSSSCVYGCGLIFKIGQ
jgi:uncharacterized repeat protein (TIGR03803 family)